MNKKKKKFSAGIRIFSYLLVLFYVNLSGCVFMVLVRRWSRAVCCRKKRIQDIFVLSYRLFSFGAANRAVSLVVFYDVESGGN